MSLFRKSKPEKYKMKGKYFSSHPDIHKQKTLELVFEESGVSVYSKKDLIKTFKWNEISEFDTDTESQSNTSQRITATRMVTLGIFSLAVPKKTGSTSGKLYDILKTTTGNIELETYIQGGNPSSLTGSIINYSIAAHTKNGQNIKRFVAERASGTIKNRIPKNLSAADELKKYARLKDNGIITESEFKSAKKKLLGL